MERLSVTAFLANVMRELQTPISDELRERLLALVENPASNQAEAIKQAIRENARD